MPASLAAARYTIATAAQGQFASVSPSTPAFQDVRLDLPIQAWTVKPLSEPNTFKLQVGGYPATGVHPDDKVFASVYPENDVAWHVTYRPGKGAYTVELADNPTKGWTVKDSPYSHIALMEFQPDFHDQLFRFQPISE